MLFYFYIYISVISSLEKKTWAIILEMFFLFIEMNFEVKSAKVSPKSSIQLKS